MSTDPNMNVERRLRTLVDAFRNLGPAPAVRYLLTRARTRAFTPRAIFPLYSQRVQHPLYCRPRSSDGDVFIQIFVEREYRCLDEVRDAKLIIDCGANVGFASAYFLSAYPRADLIAVEPDPSNFTMLQLNLAPFGSRVRTVNSGVWSSSVGLKISEAAFGDGREWSRTVRPVKDGEKPSMMAVDVGSLLRDSGHERISILKIDVEGAERQVFADNYEAWLDKVDNLVIELHGPDCEEIFHKAVAPQGFAVSTCDELTVCRRTGAA